MRIGGLLLTGGASTRLGRPKHEILRGDERLADRGARVLRAVCDPVVEVGPGVSDLPLAREDPPSLGPLAGLCTGQAALRADGYDGPVIALAVDLPLVEPELLRWLANHPARGTVVPRVGGMAQSLCARYAVSALDAAAQLVDAGERSLRALLAAVDVTYVDEPDWSAVADPSAFTDIDTPEDLDRLAGFGVSKPE